MFYSQNMSDIRRFYLDAWNKYLNKLPLSSLEQQICQVLEQHSEYQKWLNESFLETTFDNENPFLHLGLHLAIREQVQTDRPLGIQEAFFSFVKKHPQLSNHESEHVFMDVLAQFLWQAQQQQKAPDEQLYLNACLAL